MSCPFCEAEYEIQDAHREREIKPGLIEHGLYCEGCNKLVHTYYDSDELRKQREKISALTDIFRKRPTQDNANRRRVAIESYRRQFEKFQEKTLRKFNLPTDDSVIVWDYSNQNKEE